jgi:hypothetical protein
MNGWWQFTNHMGISKNNKNWYLLSNQLMGSVEGLE